MELSMELMGSAWSMPRLGPERSTSERAHDLSLLSMSSHTMWLNNRMLTCIEHVELPVLLLTEGSGATFETECGGVAADHGDCLVEGVNSSQVFNMT